MGIGFRVKGMECTIFEGSFIVVAVGMKHFADTVEFVLVVLALVEGVCAVVPERTGLD
jgi:hypothetical protein